MYYPLSKKIWSENSLPEQLRSESEVLSKLKSFT